MDYGLLVMMMIPDSTNEFGRKNRIMIEYGGDGRVCVGNSLGWFFFSFYWFIFFHWLF